MINIRNNGMNTGLTGYRKKEIAMKGKCNGVIMRKNENGMNGRIVKKRIMKK
jgi:hypothetical protein